MISKQVKNLYKWTLIYECNIVNTYAPPSDVNKYVQFATKYFNAVRNIDNSILIGDWNLLLTDSMCNKKRNKQHKKNPKANRTLLQELDRHTRNYKNTAEIHIHERTIQSET